MSPKGRKASIRRRVLFAITLFLCNSRFAREIYADRGVDTVESEAYGGLTKTATHEYHTFPGDEAFDYFALWRVTYAYLAVSSHIHNLALRCGLKVSAETMERWLRLWAAVRMLDNLVDDYPEHRREAGLLFKHILEDSSLTAADLPKWMDPDTRDDSRQPDVRKDILQVVGLLRNSMKELGDDSWQMLCAFGLEIRDTVPLKMQTSQLRAYRSLLVYEGWLTAELILVCTGPKERQMRWQHRRFRGALNRFCTLTGIYDHRQDLVQDYEAARINVTPSRRNGRIMHLWELWETIKLGAYPRNAFSAVLHGKKIIYEAEQAMKVRQLEILGSA